MHTTAILTAQGNGKTVTVFKTDGHRQPRGYLCRVTYEAEPHLNFEETRPNKAAATRFFNCWKLLAA